MHSCTHNDCIESALQEAESLCNQSGLRFTALRRKVLGLVWSSHSPAKAYDILDKLGKGSASAKPPTVYRALDFLLENGLIHKLQSKNAYVGCAHPRQHNACYFLVCTDCGEINECCNNALPMVIEETARQHHFSPARVTLEIEGVCRDCRAA